MSIIFEALKKIESERDEGGGPAVPLSFAPSEGAPPLRAKASRRRRVLTFAAVAVPLILLALLVLRPELWGLSPSRRPAPAPVSLPPVPPVIKEVHVQPRSIIPFSRAPSPESREAPPLPRAAGLAADEEVKLPDLTLKGVSRGTRRSWAFINNKMLKEGDVVEGAEVSEILSDRVTMKYKGVKFVLTY